MVSLVCKFHLKLLSCKCISLQWSLVNERKEYMKQEEKKYRNWNFFIRGYQSIKPEEIESFTTGSMSLKAALLNPLHVWGHQPPKMYINCPMIIDQPDMINAPIAPGIPKFSLITKIQDNNTWSTNEEADNHPIIMFLSWACRYIWMVMLKTKE